MSRDAFGPAAAFDVIGLSSSIPKSPAAALHLAVLTLHFVDATSRRHVVRLRDE